MTQNKTICIACTTEKYEEIIDNPSEIRSYLETLTEDRELDNRLTLGVVSEDDDDGSVVIMI